MKSVRRLCILLCLLLLLPTSVCADKSKPASYTAAADTAAALTSLAGAEEGALLSGEQWPAGTAVCDWTALAMARLNLPQDYDAYAQQLNRYVSDCYAQRGRLDAARATEYHRIALTAMALGLDPTAMGTDGSIDLIADGTYGFDGGAGKQGVNGWIFALICISAKDFDLPEGYVRQVVGEILAEQRDDGGFGLMPDTSDPDITAMALQALAAQRDDSAVQAAAERAFAWLSGRQASDGSFTAYDQVSCETTAQVILALCAWDLSPAQDSRFVKNGANLLDVLNRFRLDSGVYRHTLDDTDGDRLTTEQALLAQTAVWMQETGQGSIYDFRHAVPPASVAPDAAPWAGYLALGCGVLLLPAAALFLVKKSRNRKQAL